MTVTGDIQEYIEENINTVVPPTPLEYAPYETDNPNFKLESAANGPQAAVTGTTKSISASDLNTDPQQPQVCITFCAI